MNCGLSLNTVELELEEYLNLEVGYHVSGGNEFWLSSQLIVKY